MNLYPRVIWNARFFPSDRRNAIYPGLKQISLKYLHASTNLLKGSHVILRILHIDPCVYSGYQSRQQDIRRETVHQGLISIVWRNPLFSGWMVKWNWGYQRYYFAITVYTIDSNDRNTKIWTCTAFFKKIVILRALRWTVKASNVNFIDQICG